MSVTAETSQSSISVLLLSTAIVVHPLASNVSIAALSPTVLVNGEIVVENGKHTGKKPGKVLYGPGYRS